MPPEPTSAQNRRLMDLVLAHKQALEAAPMDPSYRMHQSFVRAMQRSKQWQKNPIAEPPSDSRPLRYDPEWARKVMAVRMVDWGHLGKAHEPIGSYIGEIFGVGPKEGWRIFDEGLGAELTDAILGEKDNLNEHQELGPVPEGHVRFMHSILHGDTPGKRWEIIERILEEGIKPQPKGIGAHSEAPWLVFGIARVEPEERSYRDLIYNPYMPYVTADIPFEALRELADIGGGTPPDRSTQMSFWCVPREYIVAVNGLPVDEFIEGMQELGYPAPAVTEENPGYETEDGFIDWRDEPDGEHGPGIWVTEMAVDDEKQGQGIGRHLYQQVEAQWPEGTLVYVYALAKEFWEKMGFEPLYRQPDGVEWYDEDYGSVDYWNQLDMELVKRIGGNTPPPIVVTPEGLLN